MEYNTKTDVNTPLSPEEEDIKDIEDCFNIAWNRHQPADMVKSLVEDAQFVTVNGVWVKSRAAFLELLARLHSGPLKDTKRETLEFQVRFLAPDIAVVHSRFRISGDVTDEGKPIPPRDGIGMRVVRKHNGRWQTIAVQNTDILKRRQ